VKLLGILVLVALYLGIGHAVYRARWPQGFLAPRLDPDRERWRKQKRTRVLVHGIEDHPED